MTEKPLVTEEERKWLREEYQKVEGAYFQQVRRKYGTTSPKPPFIVYCMSFYEERMPQVIQCIKRVRRYVDKIVLVYDNSVTEKSIAVLAQKYKCWLCYRGWDNHFSKQRNVYLAQIEDGQWVLVSDPDELYSRNFLKDMRKILFDADKAGINTLCINAHDITTELDGTVTTTTSDWFKQLIFKFEEGVRYAGCVHETLLPGVHGWRPANLDKRYYYEHIKSMVEVKERGARNVFCGGGGNNVKEKNPMYVEWHEWAEKHEITDWPSMREYIRKGNINEELKFLFVNHRNDSGWDYENESRDPFLWYKALFPEEMERWYSNPLPPSKGSPPEVMAYVEEQYLKILGRNADDPGKQAYTEAIVSGVVKREELPRILMSSEEYTKKHPSKEKEGKTLG